MFLPERAVEHDVLYHCGALSDSEKDGGSEELSMPDSRSRLRALRHLLMCMKPAALLP